MIPLSRTSGLRPSVAESLPRNAIIWSNFAIFAVHLSLATSVQYTSAMLDGLTSRLEHYMDLLSARQRLVASNIANADTPGYTTKDLDFQFEFMSQIKGLGANTIEVPGLAGKSDGNNVSLDREARLLAENAIRFNLASNLVRSQLRAVKNAIQEGKGA
jgi:flagellar basal-body rod protein FlgB